jgi:hypothetical protein
VATDPLNRLTKNNYPRSALPKINWGRGRLGKYESFPGFSAKFCRLNQLTPQQFRDFWNRSVNAFHFEHKDERVGHIARILDEPVAVAKTVFWNTGLGWGHFSVDQKSIDRDNKIAFCPTCLADGYHGYFHESDWLRKCPIHCVELTTVSIPSSSRIKADRYLPMLASLLDLNCPGWETTDGKYVSKATVNNFPVFQKFLDWHKTAQKSITEWSDACLGVFGYNCLAFYNHDRYRLCHLNLLLGRLSWITPMPKPIAELFVASALAILPEVQHYD